MRLLVLPGQYYTTLLAQRAPGVVESSLMYDVFGTGLCMEWGAADLDPISISYTFLLPQVAVVGSSSGSGSSVRFWLKFWWSSTAHYLC